MEKDPVMLVDPVMLKLPVIPPGIATGRPVDAPDKPPSVTFLVVWVHIKSIATLLPT